MVNRQVAYFIVLPHVNMDPIIKKINFNCDYNVFQTVVVDLLRQCVRLAHKTKKS